MTLEELLETAAAATAAPAGLATKVAQQLKASGKAGADAEALVRALGQGLAGTWRSLSPRQLGCARAALWGLERMLRESADERQAMVRAAEHDADNEKKALDRYGEGRWRCPRCGSQRIDDEHTGRDRQRFTQLLCDACGHVGDGFDGAATLEAWRRG